MVDFIVTSIGFVLFCAGLDRLRGKDTFLGAAVSKFLYGFWLSAWLAYYGGADAWVLLASAGLLALGSAPGWGSVLGAVLEERPMRYPYEGWQRGVLQENTVAALVARGLMWGAPVLPLALFVESWAIIALPAVAIPVAFTVAPYAVLRLPAPKRWAAMEYVRGAVTGLILVGGVALLA